MVFALFINTKPIRLQKKSIAEQLIRDKIIPFIDESAESGCASYTSTKPTKNNKKKKKSDVSRQDIPGQCHDTILDHGQ